jgi:hypothetical protein
MTVWQDLWVKGRPRQLIVLNLGSLDISTEKLKPLADLIEAIVTKDKQSVEGLDSNVPRPTPMYLPLNAIPLKR